MRICEQPLRLQTEALVACKLIWWTVWLLLELSEKFADCVRIETFEGYDRVVIVIDLAESVGGSGMEIIDDEVLELKR